MNHAIAPLRMIRVVESSLKQYSFEMGLQTTQLNSDVTITLCYVQIWSG